MSITPNSATPQLQNARTRFALSGDQIYSYEQAKYLPIAGTHTGKDGVTYDLVKVAAAIRANQFIESALVYSDSVQYVHAEAEKPAKPHLVKAPVVK